jgi:hypothetical protein
MRGIRFVFCMIMLLGLVVPMASAATIDLAEYGFNLNGAITTPSDALPGYINDSGFNWTTGLGNITATVTGAGNYSFIAYFDHEIDEATTTVFNEYGVGGTPVAGQSWEIDEPGWTYGDIYDNFLAGSLDNTNGVPFSSPDDVSMALGYNFTLTAGQTATIAFYLNTTAPTSGFYLQQTDPDSGVNIYFSSNLNITGGNTSVPEPSMLMLMLSGLGFVGVAARFRKSA